MILKNLDSFEMESNFFNRISLWKHKFISTFI